MKKEREKWLIKGRKENEEQQCHNERKEAHKIIKNERMLFIKPGTESLEEDQKRNNTRETYSDVGFIIYTNSCGDCVILVT